MNREDTTLRLVDLKIRLFVEYARQINIIYEEAKRLSDELNNGMIFTSSVLSLVEKKNKVRIRNDNLIELITTEESKWNDYYEMEEYIRYFAKKLSVLTEDELDLLYLRYERGLTLRQMGDLKFYSYMQVQRELDKILEKIFEA